MREPDRHLALAADSPTVRTQPLADAFSLAGLRFSRRSGCVLALLQGKIKLRCGAGFRLYTVYVTNEPPPSAYI